MQHLLSTIYYLLSTICRGHAASSTICRFDGKGRRSGFTLIEMVAVILILSVLSVILMTGLSRARGAAWRIQARESCRELCEAWNAYLLDERAFPEKSEFTTSGTDDIEATAKNIAYLIGEKDDVTSKVYIELTDEEKVHGGGLRDHWNQYIHFTLDFDYAGEVKNPYPEANGLTSSKVRASVIAWSLGDPKHDKRADRKIVVW